MNTNKNLHITVLSDLHFGNPRIDATELFRKLKHYAYPQIKKSHLVILAGDIYDRLLTVNSKSYLYTMQFIDDLFRMSDDTGCQIRLLHGTYSHDRDQLDVFHTLASPHTRYKIIKEISSEVITDFQNGASRLDPSIQLRIGYIPDNLPYREVSAVIDNLNKSMTVTNITHLDLLIGHGTFAHTLPDNIPLPPLTFTLDTFKDVVDGIIVMGHIHVHSHKSNVYYCGSFERMSHNEEEYKGFYSFDWSNKQWRAKFIHNEEATPFVSVNLTEMDVAQVTRQYIDFIDKSIPNKIGYVRIIHPDPSIRSILGQVSLKNFPNIIVATKAPKDLERKLLKVLDLNANISEEVKPTRENLGELVFQFLTEKGMVSDITESDVISHVSELIK